MKKGKAKKTTRSQALRLRIKDLWELAHSGRIKEEAFYNECMDKFFNEIDEQIDIYN